jgi:hypothetical protein
VRAPDGSWVQLMPRQRVLYGWLLAHQAHFGGGATWHQAEIGQQLGCKRHTVLRDLKLLRERRLVVAVLIKANHALPWEHPHKPGRPQYSRNKVCRYWARADAVGPSPFVEPIEPVSDLTVGATEQPSPSNERETDQTPPPSPSRPRDHQSDAPEVCGHQKSRPAPQPNGAPREPPIAPSPASETRVRPTEARAEEREQRGADEQRACRKASGRGERRATCSGGGDDPPEFAALAARWAAFAMPHANGSASYIGPRERQAWRNRIADGITVAELADAVEGAGRGEASGWLRRHAKAGAFAVVFANAPAVRRFAAEGRAAVGSESAQRRRPLGDPDSEFARKRDEQLRRAREEHPDLWEDDE